MIKQAEEILSSVFGYSSFRPLQKNIIKNILSKNDTLVLMPTGGGKSLCYQIPALIFKGTTIVISPLISLMKDQVEQLKTNGVAAEFLNSSLSTEEYSYVSHLVRTNSVKLLYMAPETLLMERTINLLESIQIDCITIDEAHCISEWGHDFRPEYRRIVEIKEKFPEALTVALTATATPRVQSDIKDTLSLKKSNEFIASFNRDNLYLEIIEKTEPVTQTVRFLEKYPNQSGIIYCFSRKQVDSLSETLSAKGFSIRPYHAGLSETERAKNQELFIMDDIQIIVATIAFGMGINKSNVRFVIHFDLPKNIESYYQEIGRAGRDGLRAHCLLLFGYGDIQKQKYFIDQKEEKERLIALNHMNQLVRLAETGVCRRKPMLNYFGERYEKANCGMCDNCNSKGKELVDITIHAQKYLSCVKRTNEIFGANHIIDVLRGSESKKILDHKHHHLTTYGIGKDLSKEQWQFLARQFIHQELLKQDLNFGSLKVTEKGIQILKGDSTVTGIIKQVKTKDVKKVSLGNYDEKLFDRLKQLRKQISEKLHVPPFVVFSDKTLAEMSSLKPKNKMELLEVSGVGEVKYQKFGKQFLNAIKFYNDTSLSKSKDSGKEFKFKESKKLSIGERFNNGESIADLMNSTKLKRSTIISHIVRLGENFKIKKTERLLLESMVNDRLKTEVFKLLKNEPKISYLKMSKIVRPKIAKEEFELLRIYFLLTKNNH